ncbi:MAG: DUF4242 domain-containing protein [Bacteroidales bacterium]|nr:DUF4242 domain-containing protein [Bacteroidales bacterium]
MPIFMDRHDVSETVTAENVAQLHQEDLKIQHEFKCRGLTYWFDEKRKTAFCLVEAPDEQAIKEMHNQAHGEVPHVIIEVDASIVESFLGRIEDPISAQNAGLNIINDPAFRTIMAVRLETISLTKNNPAEMRTAFLNSIMSVVDISDHFQGRIGKQNEESFLVSFDSVSNALSCALEIQAKLKGLSGKIDNLHNKIRIGLSAGVPVAEKKAFFEDTIKLAERMCYIANTGIVVSTEVRDLYKSENSNVFINNPSVLALTPQDEKFLTLLMDFTEKAWRNTDLKVDDFSIPLGCSKSQLYRKMVTLTGKSPNTFIKEFRLNNALRLLNKNADNISEIAFDTGFNSPSYFSKCFHKRFGLLPSEYLGSRG